MLMIIITSLCKANRWSRYKRSVQRCGRKAMKILIILFSVENAGEIPEPFSMRNSYESGVTLETITMNEMHKKNSRNFPNSDS